MSAREHLFSVLGETRPESSCESLPAVVGPHPLLAPPAPRPHLPRQLRHQCGGPPALHTGDVSPCAAWVGAAKLAVSPSSGPSDLRAFAHACPVAWALGGSGGSTASLSGDIFLTLRLVRGLKSLLRPEHSVHRLQGPGLI